MIPHGSQEWETGDGVSDDVDFDCEFEYGIVEQAGEEGVDGVAFEEGSYGLRIVVAASFFVIVGAVTANGR